MSIEKSGEWKIEYKKERKEKRL